LHQEAGYGGPKMFGNSDRRRMSPVRRAKRVIDETISELG
jgi:hypothetical protein